MSAPDMSEDRLSRSEVHDVAIIGTGPAGITAAIQLKRYQIEQVVFEKGEVGGLLRNANMVENYPGFPRGISGIEMVRLFEKQLIATGVRVNFERVKRLEYEDGLFFIKTDRSLVRAKFVVVASGTIPKKLPFPPMPEGGLDMLTGLLLYEIYPIIGAREKKIAIIGAGDAAFDYALNLSRENEVIIINRGNKHKCLPLLMDRCMELEDITYLTDIDIREIRASDRGVTLTFSEKGGQGGLRGRETSDIEVDYILAAIGREPCLNFVGDSLKRNLDDLKKKGGLYMIGDVINGIYRQTAISVGDGLRAAMEIYNVIKRETE